jgi:hypothetical protein
MGDRPPLSRCAVASLAISCPWFVLMPFALWPDWNWELPSSLAATLTIWFLASGPLSLGLAIAALVQVQEYPGQVRSLRLAIWAIVFSLLDLGLALMPLFNRARNP